MPEKKASDQKKEEPERKSREVDETLRDKVDFAEKNDSVRIWKSNDEKKE